MNNMLSMLISILALTFLVSCSSNGSSFDDSNTFFSSSAVTSEPTIDNAKEVRAVVAKNQKSLIKSIYETIKEKFNVTAYTLNATFSLSEPCSGGGSIDSTSSEITSDINFLNCSESDALVNGQIFGIASDYNETYNSYDNINIEFISDMIIIDPEYALNIYSRSTIEMDFTNEQNTTNMKMTLNLISDIDGVKYGQENAVFHFDYSDGNESMYQSSGKIYIDNLNSYVEYDTSYDMSQTPFTFNDNGLESGEARYIMENNASLKIIAQNGHTLIYIDTDNDGTYELSE